MTKKLLLSAAVLLGSNLFAANAKVDYSNKLINDVQKEIKTIHSYGLEPINTAEKKEITNLIKREDKNPKITFLGKKPFHGFIEYFILERNQPIVFYKDLQKDLYLVGYVFDKSGKNLSIQEAKDVFKKVKSQQYVNFFNEIKKQTPDFIVSVQGKNRNGKDIVIFTDPQCPFCKRFIEKMNGLDYVLNNYNHISIVLYPLSFHKEAAKRSLWAVMQSQGKSDKEKIEIFKQSGEKDYDEILKETKNIPARLKKELHRLTNRIKTPMMFGTPSIVDTKGNDIRDEVMRGAIQSFVNTKGKK